MDKQKAIDLASLLETAECIDVVSVESEGRPIAERMREAMGKKAGNFVRVRPTHHTEEIQIIENVKGVAVVGRPILVCDGLIYTGNTLNVVIAYLVIQGHKPKNIYGCVKHSSNRFFETRQFREVGLVDYVPEWIPALA